MYTINARGNESSALIMDDAGFTIDHFLTNFLDKIRLKIKSKYLVLSFLRPWGQNTVFFLDFFSPFW